MFKQLTLLKCRRFEREDSISQNALLLASKVHRVRTAGALPIHRRGLRVVSGASQTILVFLDVVNVNLLLATDLVVVLVRVSVAELEVGLAVLALAEAVRLVDLGVLGELAVGLEGTGLVGSVLEDHVALVVLEVSEGEEDDVALVDPDLLSHLATDLKRRRVSMDC